MLSVRLPIAVATVVAVLSCDPRYGVRSSVSLRPVPETTCVDSTLAASRLLASVAFARVETIGRSERRWHNLLFVDSLIHRFPAYVATVWTSDSLADMTVGFSWGGRMSFAPDSTRARMAMLSGALLREVLSVCARNNADTIVCTEGGMFARTRRCAGPAT